MVLLLAGQRVKHDIILLLLSLKDYYLICRRSLSFELEAPFYRRQKTFALSALAPSKMSAAPDKEWRKKTSLKVNVVEQPTHFLAYTKKV